MNKWSENPEVFHFLPLTLSSGKGVALGHVSRNACPNLKNRVNGSLACFRVCPWIWKLNENRNDVYYCDHNPQGPDIGKEPSLHFLLLVFSGSSALAFEA